MLSKNIQACRYKELDALRGIAALIVVLFHYTMGRPEAQFGFNLGTTGVDLFFIISGFVIFMSLAKVKDSSDFVINRVSRLYPTYWACVSFTFILICAASLYLYGDFRQINILAYLGNLTMFQLYLNISDLDGPYWTMIVEMIFYISILILFHFKLLKFLNIIGITLSVFVAVMTSVFYDYSFIKEILLWIPLLQFIPLFFAGTIFYKMKANKSGLVEQYLILAICLTTQILLFYNSGRSHQFITHIEYATMLTIYFALFIFFVNGKLSFIVSKGTLFLGKISFALYLIHQFISIEIMIPFLTQKLQINFWIASLIISLPIVIILSTIITYYIEIPMSKRMKEKLCKLKTVNIADIHNSNNPLKSEPSFDNGMLAVSLVEVKSVDTLMNNSTNQSM